jgi:hypothetical protein
VGAPDARIKETSGSQLSWEIEWWINAKSKSPSRIYSMAWLIESTDATTNP